MMKADQKTYSLADVSDTFAANAATAVLQADSKRKSNNSHLSQNTAVQLFDDCLVDYSGRHFACGHQQCNDFYECFTSHLSADSAELHALRPFPDDRLVWCNEAMPDIAQFVENISPAELSAYRFSFNHRYIRKDGQVSQFLHEGTLAFSDEPQLPMLRLKVFTEIGDIKTDKTLVLTISKYASELGYQKVFSKIYGETGHGQLSKREMEIIKLCFQGLSSKMIADRLNLSIHTVKNHKRNSMEKTLTHNLAELINLCIRSRWM